MGAHVDEAKKAIRSRVWDLLVQDRALRDGRLRYVAVPRLAAESARAAATRRGSGGGGPPA